MVPGKIAIDLAEELLDGQRSHFRVTLREFASYEDTAIFTRPPAHGFSTWLLHMCDHTGTHVDAPSHFFPEAATIDTLPPEAFYGPALCVDFSSYGGSSVLTARDLETALQRSELSIETGDILLATTGQTRGRVGSGYSRDFAESLVELGVKSFGVDRPTPDSPDDQAMPVHMVLLRAGITIVEGLVNLERLSGKRFFYVGAPLRLQGASGSPVRPLAFVD